MAERWHRHLGVYGICVRNGKMLLIHKKAGPYANRYDLPVGSAEPDETLAGALRREFREETGVGINVIRCLGVQEFVVPHRSEASGTTHIHHVAIYYEVECLSDEASLGAETDNNDSAGAEWVELGALHSDNSSPHVMQAWDWVSGKAGWRIEAARLDDWTERQ